MDRVPGTAFTMRPATRDDLPEIVTVFNAYSMSTLGVEAHDVERVRREWTTPGFDPATATRAVLSESGAIVAYAEVWDIEAPCVQVHSWARVHPDFQRRGIGSALLTWIEERAHEVIPKAPPEARVTLSQGIWTQDTAAPALLRAAGFEIVRHFWRMVIELDAPIPAPIWPNEIALRTYNPESDLEAVVHAFRDSFADHWGYVPQPFDADLAQWRNSIDENPDHDPSLWFLAWDGDRVAGIALSEPSIPEDPKMGFVDVLAVPRPWRRRGLATALLRHTFRTFAERGQECVGLGVDSTNLTGAIGLYEKIGMHVARQIDVFQKELRPGVDLSRQAL